MESQPCSVEVDPVDEAPNILKAVCLLLDGLSLVPDPLGDGIQR